MELTIYTHPVLIAPIISLVLALIVKTILEFIP